MKFISIFIRLCVIPRISCIFAAPNIYGFYTVIVAQLVRALDCGSRGRGFESHHSPKGNAKFLTFFFMTTIIFSQPWHGSFNKAILDTVTEELQNKQVPYQVIDLNKDGFNPVMTEGELSLFAKGASLDPLVSKYQQILKDTDRLIFIFPLWWSDVPAILKGFFDKVMLKKFAYTATNRGLKGKLTHIQSAKVIVTGQAPK